MSATTTTAQGFDAVAHIRGIGEILQQLGPTNGDQLAVEAGALLRLFAQLDADARATLLTAAEVLTSQKAPLTPRNPAIARGFFRALFNITPENQALLAQIAWKLARWDEMYPADLMTQAQVNEDARERWELPASTLPPDWWAEK